MLFASIHGHAASNAEQRSNKFQVSNLGCFPQHWATLASALQNFHPESPRHGMQNRWILRQVAIRRNSQTFLDCDSKWQRLGGIILWFTKVQNITAHGGENRYCHPKQMHILQVGSNTSSTLCLATIVVTTNVGGSKMVQMDPNG